MGDEFKVPVKLCELGLVVATPGVIEATSHEYRMECLARHIRGDWGIVNAEDHRANFEALITESRLLSAYPLDALQACEGLRDTKFWIITEADRSATTFLLPSEY